MRSIHLLAQGKFVYLVRIHIANDIHAKQKTCQGVLEEMEQTGIIIKANFDLVPAAELDSNWTPPGGTIEVLFASILKPGDINVLFEVQDENILELRKDLQLYHLDGKPARKRSSC